MCPPTARSVPNCAAVRFPSLRGAPAGERTGSHVRRLGGLVAGHGRVSGGLPVSPGRDALVSVRETAPCGGKLHARAVGDGGIIGRHLYSQ